MKVAVIKAPKAPIAFEERPVPDAGPGQIRIKVAACGVCHSDLHIWEGFFSFARLPVVPGHEAVGLVDQVGPDVTQWKIGDRAGMPWIYSTCGHCDACVAGDDPGCPEQQATGVSVDGGYAPYLIAPADYATRVPDGLDMAEAAPFFCAGLTVYGGFQRAGIKPGMTVAVQGVGGLGHFGLLIARALDTKVVAITRGKDKLALARELGAAAAIDAAAGDPGDQLAAMGGADIVLSTAPNAAAMAPLLKGLRNRGSLVIVGATPDSIPVGTMDLMVRRGQVIGSVVGTRKEMRDLLDLAVRKEIRPIIEKHSLEAVPQVFERMEKNQVRLRAVLVF